MKRSDQRAFTIIELLIVIAIIAVLVVIVVVAVNPVRLIQDAQDSKRRSDLQQIKAAMQLYYNDCRFYPPTSGVVFGSALGGPGNGPDGVASTCDDNNVYMKQVPAIPTGASYTYSVDATPAANYEVTSRLNRVSTDDTSTQTKCASTISGAYADGSEADFVVCND